MNELLHYPTVRIRRVDLRVLDLERTTAFYRDVLGFTVVVYGPYFGIQAAFLTTEDYQYHIALNSRVNGGSAAMSNDYTGLHHVAIFYPNRSEFDSAVRRIVDHAYPIDSTDDHDATRSVFLRDPDGNRVELKTERQESRTKN
jgi:catechol 2,3-dioxygenase